MSTFFQEEADPWDLGAVFSMSTVDTVVYFMTFIFLFFNREKEGSKGMNSKPGERLLGIVILS